MKQTVLTVGLAPPLLPVSAGDSSAVKSTAPERAIPVCGAPGQPLGRVITIEGSAVEGDFKRRKAQDGEKLFRVTKVNGKNLPEPCVITPEFFSFISVDAPADGGKHTFRGCEDGGFSGDSARRSQREDLVPTTAEWHFSTRFCVIKQEPPKR